MSGPNWKIDDDRKTVTVTFPTTPPVALKLGVTGVEDILARLGDFRATMAPEVAHTFAMGQKVEALPDPAWVVEPELMAGDTLLHMRDSRYGWLHYLIPRDEARKLAALLIAQADAPPAPRDKPN